MLTFTTRRLTLAVPTLLFISLVIFALLEFAPGDPMAQVPLTVPPEVKQKMREALGLGQPWPIRFGKWVYQFFVIEPAVFIDWLTRSTWLPDTQLSMVYDAELDQMVERQRVISWQTRGPVMDIVLQRIPQTLWVVGCGYLVGILIALPIGIISAYKQYSVFDQVGTFIAMVGFSIPPFFSGVLVIVIFSVQLGWLPSIYDTTLVVNDWESFKSNCCRWSCQSWSSRSRSARRSAGSCAPQCSTTSIKTTSEPRAPKGSEKVRSSWSTCCATR